MSGAPLDMTGDEAPCCECGEPDCAGPCDDCGAWTCVGEMHDETCCAGSGLDAIDRAEIAAEVRS